MLTENKVASENSSDKPSSILMQSILQSNKSTRCVHLLVSAGYIVKGSLGLYNNLVQQSNLSGAKNLAKFAQIWNKLYSLSLGFTLLHLILNKSNFTKFWVHLQTIKNKSNGFSVSKYLRKWNLINRICVVTAIIYELIIIAIEINNYRQKYSLFKLNQPQLWYCLTLFISQSGWILFFQFMIETAVHLQSAFIIIEDRLESLQSLELNYIQSVNDYGFDSLVRSVRSIYIEVINCSRLINTYLSTAITAFYLYFVGYCLCIFSNLFDQSTDSLLVNIIRLTGGSMYLFWLTYHLVQVNKLSVKIFDKVYALSFLPVRSRLSQFINEVR